MTAPQHLKLTEHALGVGARRVPPVLYEPLARTLLDGTLLRLAEGLVLGERGAFSIAAGGKMAAIVFCRDEVDPAVVAVLTFLGERQVQVLAKRRDTRLLTLKDKETTL